MKEKGKLRLANGSSISLSIDNHLMDAESYSTFLPMGGSYYKDTDIIVVGGWTTDLLLAGKFVFSRPDGYPRFGVDC